MTEGARTHRLAASMADPFGCLPNWAGSRPQVAAGVSPAVEGGILPPGFTSGFAAFVKPPAAFPPGVTPGSTAGRMPAATRANSGPLSDVTWRYNAASAESFSSGGVEV